MTISSHKKGLEEGYIRKEGTKVKDIEKLSMVEYEKEKAEIMIHLEVLENMLKQNEEA